MENSLKDFIATARKEVLEERLKDLKDAYKRKLRDLQNARKIVANLEREIEDMEIRISEEV